METLPASLALALFYWPAQLDLRKKEENKTSLPYLNGENSNSVFCSVTAPRGVQHAEEEAGEARTEAAIGAKKSPRLVEAGVFASTTGALMFARPISSSPVADEAAAPIALAALTPGRALASSLSARREKKRRDEELNLSFSSSFAF